MPPYRNVSTVHPNLLFIGQLGEQLATKRGQPSGNIVDQDTLEETQAKMSSLYDWAKMRGDKTDQGYLVDAWHGEPIGKKGALIGPARIHRTTLDNVMEKRYYGDVWDEIRATATGNAPPPSVRHRFGNLDQQLQSPLYFVTYPEGVKARSATNSRGVIEISPAQAEQWGASPAYVMDHETGHMVSPMPDSDRRYSNMIRTFADQVRKDFPVLAKTPNILRTMAHRLAYLRTPAERAAIGNQYRRMEYGVTGNKMTNEGDIIRALRGVLDQPPMPIAKPSMKIDGMFPGDPVMQYGPRAGQPAEGYNNLRQQFRQILPTLQPRDKREFIDILKSGASTSNPNEVMYG
jgi:hypothetical protein